ncbi:hypothetical protein QCA50_000483 [Cerrena zonata]|uniref:Bromo domain-containing protein n=1 Tax=Cerrena zonata TaxID=2478898 RepID=A0AAW0GZT0_9APHY
MSSARNRRSASAVIDSAHLNNIERLLFSQAVHEFGSNAWPDVSKLLSKHPLISRPKHFFTPQTCNSIYVHLMNAAELESNESDTLPRSASHLKLARKHYETRIIELRELIAAEEDKFKTLVTEIDEIRSGQWDNRIMESLGIAPPVEPQEEEPSQPELEPEQNGDFQDTEEVSRSLTAQPEPEEHATPPPDTISTASPAVDLAESQQEEEPVEEPAEESVADEASPDPEESEPVDKQQEEEEEEEVLEQEEPAPVEDESPADSPEESQEIAELVKETTPIKAESPTTAQEPEIPDAGDEEEETPSDVEDPDVTMQATVASPTPEPEPEPELEPEAEVELELEPEVDEPMETEPPRESKRKASETSQSGPRKRAREDSEPTEEEATSPSQSIKHRRKSTHTDPPIVSKKFQNVIGMLHSTISQHRYGNIFHNPIKKSEAPDYHDIVKRPMDLKTIKSRVKDGLITNSSEFQRDVYLMFANAMMYNRPGSEIYNMAEEMMLESETHITTFRQTEGFHRL